MTFKPNFRGSALSLSPLMTGLLTNLGQAAHLIFSRWLAS